MSFQGPRYDFDKAWKEVEQFISQGLPQSALNKVNEIYGIARNEKNNPQLVKAISYKSSLPQILNEEEDTGHLSFLWEEYNKYPSPINKLVGVILYSNIKNYYRNHQYKLKGRTFIADATPSNMNDWAPRNYELALLDLAEEILSDKEALNVNSASYSEILSKYTSQGLKLRPTLLDVVSQYLLQELADPLISASSFDLGFDISKEVYLSGYEHFRDLKLQSLDPLNQAFRTLKIYQDLISFHHTDNNEMALLDADLARFSYVLQHSTLDHKYELQLKVLDGYKSIFKDSFNIARIFYQQASLLYTLSNQEDKAYLRKQAYDICREHVDETHYGQLMGQLMETITRKQLSATSSEVFTSIDSINIKVTTTNIKNLSWRLVKLPRDFRDEYNRLYESDFHSYILGLNSISEGEHSIAIDPNFFPVESTIAIPGQSYGYYAVIVSPSRDFKNIDEGLHMVTMQVSDIAYASKGNEAINILVTDRITGAPLEGAKVDLFTSYYDRSARQNRKQFIISRYTDKNGRLNYAEKEGRSVSITISNKDDFLDVNDNYYIYDYPRNDKPRKEALLFTDRAIYRPGQKIYFKGLLLERTNNRIPSLDKHMKDVEVVLRDVNYQELSRIKLKSNEFGSVAGAFILPTSGLTGQYTLEILGENDLFFSQSILVEEYRRPTFEVTLDQPSGKYHIGDTIIISGNAAAYSSANINGAKVVYRVYRSEVRRWWWYNRMPQTNERILIHHGTTLTDDNGEFNLSFMARGNKNKTWNYEVEVDVTDAGGETQSDQLSMAIGKNALSIVLEGNKMRTIDDTSSLTISIFNQAGIEFNEVLSVKVIELMPDGRKDAKNQDSPLTVIRNWKEKSTSQWISFAPEQEKFVNVKALKPGAYKIEMQAGGTTGEDYIIIVDYENENFVPATDLYVEEVQGNFAPGDEIKIRIGSPHSSLYLYQEISKKRDQREVGWIELNGSSEIKSKVQKDDYGGYFIVLTYFYNNQFESITRRINVPWTQKDLDIELITFRNTLLPGAEEEWHLKIKGKDKDQKAIELLASMYDMSLDQFKYHHWNEDLYPSFSIGDRWSGRGYRTTAGIHLVNRWNFISSAYTTVPIRYPYFTILNQWYAGGVKASARKEVNVRLRGVSTMPAEAEADAMMSDSKESSLAEAGVIENTEGLGKESVSEPGQSLRSDLEETVFFYPQLRTDKKGNIHFKFKMKEALTRWKLMLFAHDQDLKYGQLTKEVVTKKDLMVTPFFPRFFRQGDEIVVTSRVNNLSADTMEVSATIELFNARTMKPIASIIENGNTKSTFRIRPGISRNASWRLHIPEDYLDPILYRVWARSENHSDGQEGLVPVLSNKILITETEAITLHPEESYIFSMKEWRGSASRDVLNLTMEYTAHPVWVAIQSLPYLADYPHECVEQMVNKVFANEVGAHILKSIPGIKQVMEQWNAPDSKTLLSNLEKNQELKSILIEETPWLRDAMSETEQRKSIALLLDENNLNNQINNYLQKIISSQSASGGFPWFAGGRDNTYITQYVVESMARMVEMGIDRMNDNSINVMVERAINYMDEELQYRYERLKDRINRSGGNLEDDYISNIDIHYLYVRSFYPQLQVKNEAKEAHSYYMAQAAKYWMNKSDLAKALIGIIAHRSGNNHVRDMILQSFSERAIKNDLGMYWKSVSGYYWYQQPIESHTAIIRLFQEVGYDEGALNQMKLWLLNQKRTQSWSSTKSTADAIHAMLLPSGQSDSWLSDAREPTFKLNDTTVKLPTEAGAGYVKERWVGDSTSEVETISITNHNKSVGWGGIYIQYMEEINQVKSSGDSDFTIEKEIFVESIDGNHHELQSLKDVTPKVGDILVNRLVIRSNRDLEYVHLKDMRGAGTEPLNVLSGYRWKGGLGYYESTRDAATHFFIDYLSKGNYIFEYKTRVSHGGEFDNGIATIQCMYAPEFSSHSSSQLLEIK